MQLPVVSDRSVTRPLAPIADDAAGFRDAREQRAPNFVYRGEFLEGGADRAYRPQHNLQISPQNRRAIDTYHKVAGVPSAPGRILDGYI